MNIPMNYAIEYVDKKIKHIFLKIFILQPEKEI